MILLKSADGKIHLMHKSKEYPLCDMPGEFTKVEKEQEEVNCHICLNRNKYPAARKRSVSSRPIFALPISM